jgi:hypothetical protein
VTASLGLGLEGGLKLVFLVGAVVMLIALILITTISEVSMGEV